MRIIKFVDKEKANWLSAQGFICTEEAIDGKIVYSFFESPDLMKAIYGKFSSTDFFISDTIKF